MYVAILILTVWVLTLLDTIARVWHKSFISQFTFQIGKFANNSRMKLESIHVTDLSLLFSDSDQVLRLDTKFAVKNRSTEAQFSNQ